VSPDRTPDGKPRRSHRRTAPPVAPSPPPGPPENGPPDRRQRGLLHRIEDEIEERLSKIPNHLNEYRYDPWGLNPEVLKKALVPAVLAYRYWFRVRTKGIENVPPGRVLLVGNHAGQVAIDGAMLGVAMILEAEPPRVPRGMGEFWLPRLPWFNVFMHRIGSVVGTPKNCVDLLRNEEAVTVFPEGVRGMNKLWKDRYRLQRFGLGFMRLALETQTPIVPIAIVGSEEQAPAIANLRPLAKLLRMPAFPITLTWPWLGPFGLIPFPVRYHIEFARPMRFAGDPDEEDEVIEGKVDEVKGKIARMTEQGRRGRKNIFL
jgi:1-acyl-sn-glycerol-3-phosphate acyltransferase